MSDKTNSPDQNIGHLIKSAIRLGIELDESAALEWLNAIQSSKNEDDIVFDDRAGVFGHKISMLDFSTEDLAHFRKVGRLVEFLDIPGKVETALALSGSAAQSKIQIYPGDADYFERINILASTRAEACNELARLIREKAIQTQSGPTYHLMEVRFGSFPQDVMIDGHKYPAGSSISWTPEQVMAGKIKANSLDGNSIEITWPEIALDPGWCKLDWIVGDPIRDELVNVSNMLDVTWEAPDGAITPLDGFLDPYFQEIYLDEESIPIFSKLSQHGKAAKRMYNIFRLTGRYNEAAIIRELFDEPSSMLYQVWALIRTMEECSRPESSITEEMVQSQADSLILEVVRALEGDEEAVVVQHLLNLRDALEEQHQGEDLPRTVEAARDEVINIVNNFFYEKLTTVPEIKKYMDQMKG